MTTASKAGSAPSLPARCGETAATLLTQYQFLDTVRPNKWKRRSLEQRKVYCRAMQGDWWLMPQSPELLEGLQKSTFKGQVREGCG